MFFNGRSRATRRVWNREKNQKRSSLSHVAADYFFMIFVYCQALIIVIHTEMSARDACAETSAERTRCNRLVFNRESNFKFHYTHTHLTDTRLACLRNRTRCKCAHNSRAVRERCIKNVVNLHPAYRTSCSLRVICDLNSVKTANMHRTRWIRSHQRKSKCRVFNLIFFLKFNRSFRLWNVLFRQLLSYFDAFGRKSTARSDRKFGNRLNQQKNMSNTLEKKKKEMHESWYQRFRLKDIVTCITSWYYRDWDSYDQKQKNVRLTGNGDSIFMLKYLACELVRRKNVGTVPDRTGY